MKSIIIMNVGHVMHTSLAFKTPHRRLPLTTHHSKIKIHHHHKFITMPNARTKAGNNTPPPNGTGRYPSRRGENNGSNKGENSGTMITPTTSTKQTTGSEKKAKRKSLPTRSQGEEGVGDGDPNENAKKRSRSNKTTEGRGEDEAVATEGGEVNVDENAERQLNIMKLKLKQRDDTIRKMETEAATVASKKYTQGKRRWGKRNLLSTDAASQQMINNFVKVHLFKDVKFLPLGFERWSEGPRTICGMMMSTINVPSDRRDKEYWTNDIVPALVYKMQMAKNQRLQKMKVVFMRMYCQ